MDYMRTDKRGCRRGAGPKRPKHKVYCVLAKEGFVYFPIAAVRAPYMIKGSRPESYLAGMPNFFGGNKNVDERGREEYDWTALAREIAEESQGNIQVEIPGEALVELLRRDQEDGNTYRFYLVRTENCHVHKFNWQGDTAFVLRTYEEDLENKPEDYIRRNQCRYEDSFLVRMEEAHFRHFVQSLLALQNTADPEARKGQVEGMLQDECQIFGGTTIAGVNNWYGSHTAEAFSSYLEK